MLVPVKTYYLSLFVSHVLTDSQIVNRIKDEIIDCFNYSFSDFTVRHFILNCDCVSDNTFKYDVIAFVQLLGDYDD